MPNEAKASYATNDYQDYLYDVRKTIDSEISSLMAETADLALGKKICYALRTHGKRLRPALVMLSAQVVGGTIKPVKKLALSIELLHAATLIHDDILDNDLFRRNERTANSKWGVRDAVLIGDVLASLSCSLLAHYRREIIKTISQTCVLLSDGEYLDVENAHREPSERDYFETIKKKSASLFRVAAQCGAIASNGSRLEIGALAEFGENFGLAYQIKDDLLDLTYIGNVIPQDINEFRATLAIVHLCESMKPNDRESFLKTMVSTKAQKPSEQRAFLGQLYKNLEKTGSLRYCADRIDRCVDDAIVNLKPLKKNAYRNFLVQMVHSLRVKFP